MKITLTDNDGNTTGFIEIDDMSELPEESIGTIISELISKNNEYHLAKLAHEEELKKAELLHDEECKKAELLHEEELKKIECQYENERQKETTTRIKDIATGVFSTLEFAVTEFKPLIERWSENK